MLTGMDLLPTFAAIADVEPQKLHPIDGLDASSILLGQAPAPNLHEVFPYYQGPNLDAVRHGRWKLHIARHGRDGAKDPVLELYDLAADPGETRNVAAEHPDVVALLQKDAENFRRRFGDATTQATGVERRPIGRVDNPVPLTRFDPEHPYYMAMYDINEAG